MRAFVNAAFAAVITLSVFSAGEADATTLLGTAVDAAGNPLRGVMISAKHTAARRAVSVFTAADGSYDFGELEHGFYDLRARLLGYADESVAQLDPEQYPQRDFTMRAVDQAVWIHQLPAHKWFERVRFPSDAARGEFVIQCAMCHQQGSAITRLYRADNVWRDVFNRMGEMGALTTDELRDSAPEELNKAYDFTGQYGPLPDMPAPVTDKVLASVITEWDVGFPTSMLHDIVVGADGNIYAVDWIMDKLFRLDPRTSKVMMWDVPLGDSEPGGVLKSFAKRGARFYHYTPSVAPHSLQSGPDNALWITLSLGKGLLRFDYKTEEFKLVDQPGAGKYPHTMRFDSKGAGWYTLAVSNHLAKLDPASGNIELYALPTRNFTQKMFVSTIGVWIWLADLFNIKDIPVTDFEMIPIPYGIDIAPDDTVWFSQFNHRRIGHFDPATEEVEMIDTPFYGPRRLRFDSKGVLWIPSYADSQIYRFDPTDRAAGFTGFELPTGRGDLPYALAVDKHDDSLWICGTNSDTLIHLYPDTGEHVVYPLPKRVTFTREIDLDEDGAIWTSNSNMPGWQIEGGMPTVIRLQP